MSAYIPTQQVQESMPLPDWGESLFWLIYRCCNETSVYEELHTQLGSYKVIIHLFLHFVQVVQKHPASMGWLQRAFVQ